MRSTLLARARRVLFSLVLEHTEREREFKEGKALGADRNALLPENERCAGSLFVSLSDFYSARREADAMVVPHGTNARSDSA